MKTGELIMALAQKAGIKADDPLLKELFNIGIEVPHEVAEKMQNNLITTEGFFDSAKNNSNLQKYFHKQALDVIDNVINPYVSELDDASKAEISTIQETGKRITALISKVKEIEGKKAGIGNKGEKEALAKEIEKLNTDIAAKVKLHEEQTNSLKSEFENKLRDYAVQSQLRGFKYAHDQLDVDVNVMTAKNLLEQKLGEKKVKLVRLADGTLALKQAENPELDYYEDNKPVKVDDFIKRTLTESKLLKVADPAPQPPGGNGGKPFTPEPGSPTVDLTNYKERSNSQIQQLTNGQTV